MARKIPGKVVPGAAIYIVNPAKVRQVKPGQISHLFWDWDGNFSLLREGWQGVMAPVCVKAICGKTKPTEAIKREVDEMIAETTGIRTIEQMRRLVEMVRAHDLVPADQILDEWGYKKVYLDALMRPVNKRIRRVESGKCSVEDMMVADALPALRAMAQCQVTMLAFSGTDEENVIQEAGVLTAASCFAGIYGAAIALKPGEVEKDKVDRLREVMQQCNLTSSQVAGGGDGPVEIRVLHEAGGLSVGIAVDEEAGFGWDIKKVSRLVDAGADVLMPDWRWYQALIQQVLKLRPK